MTKVGQTEGASKKRIVLAGAIAGLFSRFSPSPLQPPQLQLFTCQNANSSTLRLPILRKDIPRFVIAPLDVVKIRLQLQPRIPTNGAGSSTTTTFYRGVLPTMRSIVRHEGPTALWKGNIPAELLYLSYGAVQFLAYRQLTNLLSRTAPRCPEHAQSFAAGATAGGIATAMTYPLDLLRTRFAAQRSVRAYSSLAHSVRHIAENEGTRGFFRGLGTTLTQIAPYMGLLFMTHEAAKVQLAHVASAGYIDALAGSVAGVVAKTGVFPLDLIRKRLQVQGPTRSKYVHGNIPVYVGIWGTARDIIKAEGVVGLYRGLWVSLLKAAPLTAVTMWSFETAMKTLEAIDEKTGVAL